MTAGAAGLCDSCRHQRVIRNTRGSSFSLCERSRSDPAYPRYPRLPVTECRGWELEGAPPAERAGWEGEGAPPAEPAGREAGGSDRGEAP